MSVSIIIPTYKDWPRLKLCLEALTKQSYPKKQLEVLVVSNCPEDTCPYELPGKNIRVIEEPKPGSYAARNTGVRAAKGEVISFTDSDCVPDKDWVSQGVECLKSMNADMAGGHVDFVFKNPNSAAELHDTIGNMNNHVRVKKYGCAATANLFVRKKVFDAVGLFDDSMKSGGDTEFTLRAGSQGFSIIYCAEARVKHPTRSLKASIKKAYRVGKGLLSVELKRPVPAFQKIKLLFLHMLPIPNPIKIKQTMRRHGKTSVFIFFKMAFLSSFLSLVKTYGMVVSLFRKLFPNKKHQSRRQPASG